MIDFKTYTGKAPGWHLLVFGAIHGNETCGPDAIKIVMAKLDSGEISLAQGQVTFVPVCNPEAYKQDRRYIDINLNRIIRRHVNPQVYEEKLANQLVPLIDACDVLLDLHSQHTDSPPFVFQDSDAPEWAAFAQALNIPNIVIGWPDLYDGEDPSTGGYAGRAGKVGVTVECGRHHDPVGIAVGVMCIERAMAHCGLLAGASILNAGASFTRVQMTEFVRKESGAGRLVKNWQHMDRVQAGEIIATLPDGGQLTAPYAGYMILPFHDAQAGDEWYYLGKDAA